MKKVTLKQIEKFLKNKFTTDERWTIRALMRIYEFQTLDERVDQDSKYLNGVGFNGSDATFLTSVAEQYEKFGKLTWSQMQVLYKQMPKYWRQIWEISDKNKLKEMIINGVSNDN